MIFRGHEPLVTCATGKGEQDLGIWQVLAGLQEDAGGEVMTLEPPRDGSWLGVALLPASRQPAQDDVLWLGDFERSLAAAMLQARDEMS
jgi:hypothetical protein